MHKIRLLRFYNYNDQNLNAVFLTKETAEETLLVFLTSIRIPDTK